MKRLLLTSIAILIMLVPMTSGAELPQPKGFVNDFAGVINADTKDRLEGMLQAIEQKSGVEIAVVTIPSLDERPIEDYAVDLYQKWGIGKKGVDDGVLILVAPNDKRVRIEVGYGLEGAINDAMAGRIIREGMVPYFKQNDFTRGIVSGAQAVAAVALKEKGIEPKDVGADGTRHASTSKKKGGPLRTAGKIIVFLIMAYLFIRHPWLFLFFLASAGRGGLGGGRGGFGGGFGGFGGGLSGGGGASGRW